MILFKVKCRLTFRLFTKAVHLHFLLGYIFQSLANSLLYNELALLFVYAVKHGN